MHFPAWIVSLVFLYVSETNCNVTTVAITSQASSVNVETTVHTDEVGKTTASIISPSETSTDSNTLTSSVPESKTPPPKPEGSTLQHKTTALNTTQSSTTSTDTSSTSTSSSSSTSSSTASSTSTTVTVVTTQPFQPYDDRWMEFFTRSHHFQGQYICDSSVYGFDFVVRSVHPSDLRTLVTYLHDQDGAVLELNGTSADGHTIIFKLAKIFTPGSRFPLNSEFEITGSLVTTERSQYFSGNVTKHGNFSFTWIHMSKALGTIETGEATGTRTAIIIIVPTVIAFLGICGTVAIICWASKNGYLRGRHKSYRLFTTTQVSYESEAETIHI